MKVVCGGFVVEVVVWTVMENLLCHGLLLKKCCCEVVVESLLSYGCCMKVIV